MNYGIPGTRVRVPVGPIISTAEKLSSSFPNLLFYQRISLNLVPGGELPSRNQTKLTVLGSSIARNSDPIIAANSSNKDTCVYSVSGLSLDKASVIAKDIFSDHTKDDIAVFQIGTDLYNKRQMTN